MARSSGLACLHARGVRDAGLEVQSRLHLVKVAAFFVSRVRLFGYQEHCKWTSSRLIHENVRLQTRTHTQILTRHSRRSARLTHCFVQMRKPEYGWALFMVVDSLNEATGMNNENNKKCSTGKFTC